jgi:hypothetical protein
MIPKETQRRFWHDPIVVKPDRPTSDKTLIFFDYFSSRKGAIQDLNLRDAELLITDELSGTRFVVPRGIHSPDEMDRYIQTSGEPQAKSFVTLQPARDPAAPVKES